MKTFGYIRVSGKGQVDGDGPSGRRMRSRNSAPRTSSGRSLRCFSRPAYRGQSRESTAQFAEMIERDRGSSGRARACIVVERLDRLARDLMISEFLLAECRKRKIPVYAADQNDRRDMAWDGGDPTRVLLRQILGALAQWEESALVFKLRKARDRNREATGRCEGPLPFGATPEEASAKLIMATWLYNGLSFARIAAQANQIALKTRTGQPWNRGSVYQVLVGQKAQQKPTK